MIVKNICLQKKNYRQAVKINLFPISDSFLLCNRILIAKIKLGHIEVVTLQSLNNI